ncbi:MAG: hypothetical protein MUD16_01630 [Desulfobacterales bacterium]|jgi:hypothetical protein|nr:hypothetical protein [Desulfobacterales bacterium]
MKKIVPIIIVSMVLSPLFGLGIVEGVPNRAPYLSVTHESPLRVTLTLRETFSFDYWWAMSVEPNQLNVDILFFRSDNWAIINAVTTRGGSSSEWSTITLRVPEWARNVETQIEFRLYDHGQETRPMVHLRNIGSRPATD